MDRISEFFMRIGFIITVSWLVLIAIKAFGIGAFSSSWWIVLIFPLLVVAALAAIFSIGWALTAVIDWIYKKLPKQEDK